MPNIRLALSESVSGGLAAGGSLLLLAPRQALALCGVPLESDQAVLLARVLGLRDLGLSAAVLSAGEGRTRQRLLRAIAAMCAVEAGLYVLYRDRLSAFTVLTLAGGTAVLGLQALVASTYTGATSTAGVPLLIGGYALATPPALQLGNIVRTDDVASFALFEAGAGAVAAGWLQRHNRGGGLMNAAAAIGTAMWWGATRYRKQRLLKN